jgi:hypothetical protein
MPEKNMQDKEDREDREKTRPAKVKELDWNKAGNAYVLMDKEKNKQYMLDPISFLVWIQCDGKTELEQIVDIFSVDGNRDIVKAAITGIIDKLHGNGLVKWV